MADSNLHSFISNYSDVIQKLGAAHAASSTAAGKEDYLRAVNVTFEASDVVLARILVLMGYEKVRDKSSFDRGLDVGVLRSTRNWSTVIDMHKALQEPNPEDAIEFFMTDFARVVRPTFMELEAKAKEYIFLEKKKR